MTMNHFKGKQFQQDVIIVAVGYYLRYNLSYREVQEILYDRGINVSHTTIYRWVQEYGKLLYQIWKKKNKKSANCKSKLATQINLYRRAVIKHFSWIVIHPNFNLSDLFRGRFYCAFRQKSTNHAIVILVSSSFPTRIGMSIVNITINCLR